jgi:hypothetical protein
VTLHQNARNVQSAMSWEEVRAQSRAATQSTLKVANSPAAPSPESPLAEAIGDVVANGYGPFLRPCPPPDVACWFTNPRTQAPEQRASDGKVPGRYVNGGWRGWRGWRQYEPTPADFDTWRTWPGGGLCLVTGEVGAFDIDIKVDASDNSPAGERARLLVAEIKNAIARALGVKVDALPLRWRLGTTSCMILVRMTERTGKRKLQFAADGSTHAVEFLADGQQIVIAGTHASGARVYSSLKDTSLTNLPTLTAAGVADLMESIGAVASQFGFQSVGSITASRVKGRDDSSPENVVLRQVMARRADWLPSVIPVAANAADEWRVPSAELERELDEDLVVFFDGIHDYGTERTHTPSSLIAEFGAIDETGDISFGGCPDYGPVGSRSYGVVGEPDPSVRRPTEAQALTWLCRTLSGHDDVSEFPLDATWRTHWQKVSEAIGLKPDMLVVARWFQHPANDDPTNWSTATASANADYLAALEAAEPDKFDKVAFALDLKGIDAAAIVKARREAVANMATTTIPDPILVEPLTTATERPNGDFPEPFDIFGHDDRAELGALPRDSLPPMLRRWVTSEARRKGAPEPFAAASAIGVAASAIGASQKIQVRSHDTGFTQPAALWVALVADPGSGKSPTISAALRPLSKIDAEWYAADKRRLDVWNALAPKKRTDPDNRGPEPVIRRLIVDDVTIERQIQIHAQNPRGVLRAPDELAAFLGSFGAYKKNGEADRGQALRLFDGGAVKVDRVSAGAAGIYAEQALMGVLAGTQPEKLRQKVRELGADGMLQRFLFVVHDGVDRHGIDEVPDAEADEAFAAALRLITAGGLLPTPVRLSAEAQMLLDQEVRQIRALKHLPGAPAAWGGHVEKWGMFLPRLVLTFHALEQAYSGRMELGVAVSKSTVGRAVRFGRFLLRHALHVYLTYFESDRTADDAKVIAGFILTKPDAKRLTPRTVGDWRKEFRGEKERRRLQDAMADLVTAGWLRVVEQGANGPTKWEVNPSVYTRFSDHAERERKEHQTRRDAILGAGSARKALLADELSAEEV